MKKLLVLTCVALMLVSCNLQSVAGTSTAAYSHASIPLIESYRASWARSSELVGATQTLSDSTFVMEAGREVRVRASICSQMIELEHSIWLIVAHAELEAACADGSHSDEHLMLGYRNSDPDALDQGLDYLQQSVDHLNRAVSLTPVE